MYLELKYQQIKKSFALSPHCIFSFDQIYIVKYILSQFYDHNVNIESVPLSTHVYAIHYI
jgi:hypothetical protein